MEKIAGLPEFTSILFLAARVILLYSFEVKSF